MPYETVKRVVAGVTSNPYIDTLDRFAIALGCSLGDILIGTNAVISTDQVHELQDKIDALTTENATIVAERDFANADNAILKNEITSLTAEIKLLTMQLSYKDEIIALYKIIEQERNK